MDGGHERKYGIGKPRGEGHLGWEARERTAVAVSSNGDVLGSTTPRRGDFRSIHFVRSKGRLRKVEVWQQLGEFLAGKVDELS